MDTEEPFFDGREMLMVHHMLRREFGLLPGLVRGVTTGDRERVQAVDAHLTFLTESLHHHHQVEDDYVWPLLASRCGTKVDSLVDLMDAQHAEVTRLLQAVESAAWAWRGDAPPHARAALARLLDGLNLTLREHLSTEEQLVVPLMEKHITTAEWTEILNKKGVADADPAGMPLLFGMMMYEGDPEIVDATIASLPVEAGDTIRQLATQAFVAHSQLVHGTATPPRSTDL